MGKTIMPRKNPSALIKPITKTSLVNFLYMLMGSYFSKSLRLLVPLLVMEDTLFNTSHCTFQFLPCLAINKTLYKEVKTTGGVMERIKNVKENNRASMNAAS